MHSQQNQSISFAHSLIFVIIPLSQNIKQASINIGEPWDSINLEEIIERVTELKNHNEVGKRVGGKPHPLQFRESRELNEVVHEEILRWASELLRLLPLQLTQSHEAVVLSLSLLYLLD